MIAETLSNDNYIFLTKLYPIPQPEVSTGKPSFFSVIRELMQNTDHAPRLLSAGVMIHGEGDCPFNLALARPLIRVDQIFPLTLKVCIQN